MSKNTYSIKVLNGKGKSKNVYRIQTIWNNTNFTITILDGNKAFQTSVDETMLKEQAEHYEFNIEEYVDILRTCLSESNIKNIFYNIKNNTFLISRSEQGFSRDIAEFNLEIIDFNVASANFIDELMKYNDDIQSQILINKEQKDAAINEKNICLDKLQHYVKEKEKMENELYSKFILLLNEKKLRIQYLTDLITKNKQNINIVMEEELQTKINNLRNKETISESSDDSESEDDKSCEKIVHEVQIEQTDLMDHDTEVIPLQTLPKRFKISDQNQTNNEQMKNSTKQSSQSNLEDITNANETQELEFNTQDLFDRL